jgi:hypothetical protein
MTGSTVCLMIVPLEEHWDLYLWFRVRGLCQVLKTNPAYRGITE